MGGTLGKRKRKKWDFQGLSDIEGFTFAEAKLLNDTFYECESCKHFLVDSQMFNDWLDLFHRKLTKMHAGLEENNKPRDCQTSVRHKFFEPETSMLVGLGDSEKPFIDAMEFIFCNRAPRRHAHRVPP